MSDERPHCFCGHLKPCEYHADVTDIRDHMKPPRTSQDWMVRELADPKLRADVAKLTDKMRAEQDATSVVAWKSGRNFGTWHVCGAGIWVTLCGVAVPTKPLTNVSRTRGRHSGETCRSCLRELEKRAQENNQLETT